jgi:hypothetical protein
MIFVPGHINATSWENSPANSLPLSCIKMSGGAKQPKAGINANATSADAFDVSGATA